MLVEVVSAKVVLIDVDWSVMGDMVVAIVSRQSGGGGGNSMAMQGAHPNIFKVGSSIKSVLEADQMQCGGSCLPN